MGTRFPHLAKFRFSSALTGMKWTALVSFQFAIFCTCPVPFAFAQEQPAEAQSWPEVLASVVSATCYDCHVGDTAEGGLDLEQLLAGSNPDALTEKELAVWVRVFDRVELQEMPPVDVGELSDTQRDVFARELSIVLSRAHESSKGTVLRRLNRREYQNTLNDLFGTHLDLELLLPEDARSHEFDNVGAALRISVEQLNRYMEAVEMVFDAAINNQIAPPASKVVRASYADTRGGEKFLGKNWLKLDDGAVVFFQKLGYPTGMLREANIREAGLYNVRVTGYAYQSDRPITFSIGATTFARGAEQPTFGFYSMPVCLPGETATVEIEVWIDNNYMIEVAPRGIHDDNYLIKKNGIENYAGPGLAISHIEVEGPIIREYPTRGHQLLFAGLERQEILPRNVSEREKPWYKPKFTIASSDPAGDAERALTRVAEAAFRRAVTDVQVQGFVRLFEQEFEECGDFQVAYLTACTAIFCSPEFLFLPEPSGWLDDYALASRLSYFLTRSSPDELLLADAKAGRLRSEPAVLSSHVDRLLNGPHRVRFVSDFCDAWLNLRDIDFTEPDSKLFPEYDDYLRFSIMEETHAYFEKLLVENLPVEYVVRSGFAMLNERLAEHYGIAGVSGPEIREVQLPAESPRGGLLTHASVLKVSANGTNTSPVARGVWVMERILGQAPPPPPPGIAGVEPDIRGAKTLRELLDLHRDLDSCRSCHEKIDPPGFALESFNPIGGYRERFRSLGEGEKVNLQIQGRRVQYRLGPTVDSSGYLPSGETFSGFREFRNLLAERKPHLARTMAEKLLVFATGRELGFSDRSTVYAMVELSASEGYGMRDLVHLVVKSSIFRRK